MASKGALVFATMLFSLTCMSISGQDLSKHLLKEKRSKFGFTGVPQEIKSPANASTSGSIKAEEIRRYKHYAGYTSQGPNDRQTWLGVRAQITLWKIPDVQLLSVSEAYIAAINHSPFLEIISAGFHVHPGLYNDNEVHFFTYWNNRRNQTEGCYNNECPGFVVADGTNLYPGQKFAPPLSTYGGEQRSFTIRIKKDQDTGDWSLYREDLGGPIGGMTLLGWWPKSLFRALSDHAEVIQWTGSIIHAENERSPSMGSGHFAGELDGKAASFNDCFGFDENGNVYKGDYAALSYESDRNCYSVSEWYETKHAAGRHFFYGGPGGCSEKN